MKPLFSLSNRTGTEKYFKGYTPYYGFWTKELEEQRQRFLDDERKMAVIVQSNKTVLNPPDLKFMGRV